MFESQPATDANQPVVTIKETGTGPYRYITVDVPSGVHPVSLAIALRDLPIACSLVSATGGDGSELLFKVHGHDDDEDEVSETGSSDVRTGRMLRLATDSPFAALLNPAEEEQPDNPAPGEPAGT